MQITRLLLVVIILTTTLVSTIGITNASFNDLEESVGNDFQAWASTQWAQTSQADFETGVLNNVDTSSSPGDVILENWTYRRQITIDHTKVDDVADPSTTYAEFPVLVYAAGLSNISTDGTDIRFTASDGVTELPREIESYSGGTLYAWVKVTLTKDASDSTDDIIYMYYGNASASEPAPDSTYGSENVWASDYVMVQHLNESPDGTAGEMKDSTSNANHGTTVGGMDASDSVDVKIGKGLDLDGIDDPGGDHISVPDSASLDSTVDEGTWSMWINWDDWGSEQKILMVTADRYTVPTDGYEWGAQGAGGVGNLFAYPWARDPNYNLNTGTNFTNGTSHYISVRYDWTSRTLTMTLDGNDLTNDTLNVNATNWTYQAAIDAAWLWGGSPQRPLRFIEAQIDEIRVSNIRRSAEWLTTEYRNQDNPSTFCGIGTEEDQGNWYSTSWTRRCPTNITNSTGTALSDYQVKLTLSYDSDMQGDFADIRFTDNDGTTLLPYWMQSYVASTSAIFWVKVPSIPSGAKTIYMYYGNPSASSTGDGWNTFEFFDDFSSGLGQWTIDAENTDKVYISVSAGNPSPSLRHDPDSSQTKNSYFDTRLITKDYKILDGIIEYEVYLAGTARVIHQLGWRVQSLNFENGYCWRLQTAAADGGHLRFTGRASWSTFGTAFNYVSANTWHSVKEVVSGSTYTGYVDGGGAYSGTDSIKLTEDYLVSHVHGVSLDASSYVLVDNIRVRKYASQEPTAAFGPEESSVYVSLYVSLGTIASQVLDTTMPGAVWNSLFWDETLESNTDIIFEVRAANTLNGGFPDASWIDVGGTSPVTSGLPSGRYIQWQVTLNTSDTSKTPWLHEVRVYYY